MQVVHILDPTAFGTVLRPRRELLADVAEEERRAFCAALEADAGTGVVLLDITATTRIDDAGIRLVIGCFRECQRRQQPFVVALSSPYLIQVFQAMQLHHHIDLVQVGRPGAGAAGSSGSP